jgi:hypothetical protein
MLQLLSASVVLDDDRHEQACETSIAHRFCAFAMRTLNEDLDPFFDRCLPLFEQSLEDVEVSGETLEQYAAYKEYVAALEEHCAKFAMEEGYGPGAGGQFLQDLQKAIEEDRSKAELQVESFLEQMRQRRRVALGSDNISDDEIKMLRAMFKPQTVDDLIDILLHMTEYQSFSCLMRAKVQQQKYLAEMERRRNELLQGEMGLAHRFIQFSMSLLNNGLEDFYRRCMPLFDQDNQNLELHGQTHEQYAAFQEYTQLIELHLHEFTRNEGFGCNAEALFEELQRIVHKDQNQVNERLQEVLKDVQDKKEQLRAQAQQNNEDGTSEPFILICKPAALGDLINSLLKQTEYQTFSATMRFRVEQEKVIKTLQGRMKRINAEHNTPEVQKDRLADLEVVDLEIDERNTAPNYLQTVSVVVPDGCQEGSELSLQTPEGQLLTVTVPGGLRPGMSFDVSYTLPVAAGSNKSVPPPPPPPPAVAEV